MGSADRWKSQRVQVLHQVDCGVLGFGRPPEFVEQGNATAQPDAGVALKGEGPLEVGLGPVPDKGRTGLAQSAGEGGYAVWTVSPVLDVVVGRKDLRGVGVRVQWARHERPTLRRDIDAGRREQDDHARLGGVQR